MIYIYRIKHTPTGMYFRTCGPHNRSSLDIAGQLYVNKDTIKHCILYGKVDYNWIVLRSSFKYYNEFKEKYEYKENIIKVKFKDNNKDIKYSKFKIPKSEFEVEIFKTIEEND